MPIIWVEFNAFGIGDTQAADIKVSSKLPDKEVRKRLSPVKWWLAGLAQLAEDRNPSG
jgi:hypothetical protein